MLPRRLTESDPRGGIHCLGFKLIKSRYGNDLPSMITNVTGPSRTADIEKTLVLGAHGPRELFVFLLDG